MNRKRENGADGAYRAKLTKQEFLWLQRAVEHVMNWMRLSGQTIQGKTYGSEFLYATASRLQELYMLVGKEYAKLSGCMMPVNPEQLAQAWIDCRKGNWKQLRNGEVIANDCHALPLLGEPAISPTAILYAYWGRNQKVDHRLIKVGYTAQDLAVYLRSLARMYDPQLLASCPGNKEDENAFHAQWRLFVAEGREWYWAVPSMLGLFRREWQTTPEFETLAAEALKKAPFANGG